MGKYFKTDGIRGNSKIFTKVFVTKLVDSLIITLNKKDLRILVGGDTRESTKKISDIICTHLVARGVTVYNGGILPTPALSYLTKHYKCDSSIVITASHNLYSDNGIKILNNKGEKLNDEVIEEIEAYLDSDKLLMVSKNKGVIKDIHEEAKVIYQRKLLEAIDTSLKGLNIGIDCANGATSELGPLIFSKLGCSFKIIHDDKSYGKKINKNCGSTYLNTIKKLVVKEKLDFGVAFDGDGDRCLLVDSLGNEIDGDHILAILSNQINTQKRLVITIMANQGLLNYAKENNIQLEITNVGDTNVYEVMKAKDIYLGGEQSGHIIMRHKGMSTGDGILTALVISSIIKKSGKTLTALASIMKKSPQIIKNIKATEKEKENFKTNPKINKLISKYSNMLKQEKGRINVRPSGTEPVIRITIWGNKTSSITNLALKIAQEITNLIKD